MGSSPGRPLPRNFWLSGIGFLSETKFARPFPDEAGLQQSIQPMCSRRHTTLAGCGEARPGNCRHSQKTTCLAKMMSRKNRAALSHRPANLACPADISFDGFRLWAESNPVHQTKPGPGPAFR
jgi:hypothetical protein